MNAHWLLVADGLPLPAMGLWKSKSSAKKAQKRLVEDGLKGGLFTLSEKIAKYKVENWAFNEASFRWEKL